MNEHVKSLLWELAQKYFWEFSDDCPQLKESYRRAEDLWAEFQRAHQDTPALMSEVLDLIDAQTLPGSIRAEGCFFLGLQIGRELGR